MNPQQFRLRSQIDPALAVGLLAATARPKVLQQAITAGERAQAQQLMVNLLRANVLHRTKSILPPPVEAPEEEEIVAEDVCIEDTLLLAPPEPELLVISIGDSVVETPEHTADQLAGQDSTPIVLEPVTERPILVAEEDINANAPIVFTASEAAPAVSWWVLGLLMLAIGIGVGLGVWVGWQVALAWAGLAGVGTGLYAAARFRRRPPSQ